MAARSARAHQEANSRARGLHPWQVAPVAARCARAHQETSARARRRRVKVSFTFSKVAGGAGARWAPSSARSPLPRRSVLDVCHWQTAPEAAAEKGGSAPKVLWRQQAQERLKMSRWDIFRWRTLAGGPPCRQGRQRFSHRAFLSPRPKRVPPFGISDGGGTRPQCLGSQFAPRTARSARAHQVTSARARRGMVLNSLRLVFSHLSGGVWRRQAPRPLRKTKSAKQGSPRAPLFLRPVVGRLVGISVF